MESKTVIGITGTPASGKSTLLKIFKEKGFKTLSADEIVDFLYKNNELLKNKFKNLNINIVKDSKISKDLIKEKIKENKGLKTKIEKIVHPFVIDFIKEKVKKENKIAIEVPLLFEAGMENIFSKIILVRAKENLIKKELKKRNIKESEQNIYLSLLDNIEDKVKKSNYLINNNKDLKSFKKECEEVILKIV
jgi:dephospho-CoA kinase